MLATRPVKPTRLAPAVAPYLKEPTEAAPVHFFCFFFLAFFFFLALFLAFFFFDFAVTSLHLPVLLFTPL